MAKHYVYVLCSVADLQFYVGLTDNLPGRIDAHNTGLVISTKRRVPLELIYWEGCLDRRDAAQREKYPQECMGKTLSQDTPAALSHGVNSLSQQTSPRSDGHVKASLTCQGPIEFARMYYVYVLRSTADDGFYIG